jgi:transcriptional regulator with XRE-family HTH domain
MSKKQTDLPSNQLRAIIADCGITRYELSKLTGVQQAALSRFMAGHVGLTLATLDRLAPVLGLKIVTTPQPRPKKGK